MLTLKGCIEIVFYSVNWHILLLKEAIREIIKVTKTTINTFRSFKKSLNMNQSFFISPPLIVCWWFRLCCSIYTLNSRFNRSTGTTLCSCSFPIANCQAVQCISSCRCRSQASVDVNVKHQNAGTNVLSLTAMQLLYFINCWSVIFTQWSLHWKVEKQKTSREL